MQFGQRSVPARASIYFARSSLKGVITDMCTIHVVQDMLSTVTYSGAVFGRCTGFHTCTLPDFFVRQQQTCDVEGLLQHTFGC